MLRLACGAELDAKGYGVLGGRYDLVRHVINVQCALLEVATDKSLHVKNCVERVGFGLSLGLVPDGHLSRLIVVPVEAHIAGHRAVAVTVFADVHLAVNQSRDAAECGPKIDAEAESDRLVIYDLVSRRALLRFGRVLFPLLVQLKLPS